MIRLNAFAKLNLNLHILPHRLENGFFPVKFINCQIDIWDELIFENKKNSIKVICNSVEIGSQENNLVYRAASLLKEITKRNDLGARITLKKNIPIKSGFGGGSSDAAETIKGLMSLWKIILTKDELHTLIGKLGKDVYYCYKGGVRNIEHDGSKISSVLSKMPELWLVIVIPQEKKPSTQWMYTHLDTRKIGKHIKKYFNLQRAILIKNKKEIINNLFNDFESLAEEKFPIIHSIKKDLTHAGAENTLLLGAGLSVAGFFETKKKSQEAFNELKIKYPQIICTRTKI